MNIPPDAEILSMIWNSWSFAPHRIAGGDPADYPGISVSESDIDLIYHDIPANPYITIYRKNELLWGHPPPEDKFILCYLAGFGGRIDGPQMQSAASGGSGARRAVSAAAPPRRQAGVWNLKDSRGRKVSGGTYLFLGIVECADGSRERVSFMVGVR